MKKTNLTLKEEQILHEEVAQQDSHEDQTKGIVGWFYRLYITETLRFVKKHGPLVLDIGSGEGVIFKSGEVKPVQLDVSWTRLERSRKHNDQLVCADAYSIPFKDNTFDAVLLIAVLEHTSQPPRILDEVHRILKPGGHLALLIPNDIQMSLGRVLLGKWPPRYPDHLSFITPGRIVKWTSARFAIVECFPLPFRRFSFWLNMYYFASLKKNP